MFSPARISKNFVVIDAKVTVEYAVSLASKLKPKYLLVSRMRRDKHYRYVIHTETFLDAVQRFRPDLNLLLEDFLNLHEYDAEGALEVAGDPLVDAEAQAQIDAGPPIPRQDFLILDRKGQAIGLIDPQRGNRKAVYRLKGIGHEFTRPRPPYPSRKERRRREERYELAHPQRRRYRRAPRPPKPEDEDDGDIVAGRDIVRGEVILQKRAPRAPRPPKPEGEVVLERYPSATFPKKIALEQTAPLKIVVKAVMPKLPAAVLRVVARRGELEVPILVIIKPGSFELTEEYYKTILVPVEAVDSKPVVFNLRAKKEGWQTIKVEFFQQGTYVGELEVKTLVTATKFEAGPLQPIATKAQWKLGEVPPEADLKLIIYEKKAEPEFEYEICIISTKLGITFERTGPIRFTGNPETKFRAIFQDIEREDLPPDAIEENVKAIGQTLYNELFPDKFKARYWKIRNKIKSVQLLSDEPWIPWEIVKPWRKVDGKIKEDKFLCEGYAFSRWLEGIDFKRKKRLRRAKLVVPTDTDLDNALLERDWIHKYAKRINLRVTTDSRFDEVLTSLRKGGFDLLHFSTHGLYDHAYPYLSGIALERGIELKPEHISGVATAFGKTNPLVILNACQTGAQGFALTGIGSWATQFLDAGASGFIGTLWSVSDYTAFRFTQHLYQKLFERVTLGEAVLQARNLIRQTGDPSWLAYELYGHPNSHVKLGR